MEDELFAKAPAFKALIDEITQSDPEYTDYLIHLCAYSLTGETTEGKFYVCRGEPLLRDRFSKTIRGMYGNYALKAKENILRRADASLRGVHTVFVDVIQTTKISTEYFVDLISGKPISQPGAEESFTPLAKFWLLCGEEQVPECIKKDERLRERVIILPFGKQRTLG